MTLLGNRKKVSIFAKNRTQWHNPLVQWSR